ncbi:hypothetical protein S2M10_29370 [Sphingomonas sp. S2M10]|uniref:phage capsid protein n=1 Tax=Sphingomonas sp. S2M10 TaxID=2705010 RepID=UPI0014569942|nr:phage capsid protein [Sphingomonas sp. S2M10]NLS27935.1 hypothetical protein [Sphingomonas sp. S2M10]
MAQWEQTARDIAYQQNVEMELKQEPGILYMLAGVQLSGAGASEVKVTDRFGNLKLNKKTVMNGDTNYTDVSNTRRFAKKPGSSNVATLIDRDAANSTSVDPKSPLVMGTADAVKQYHDDVFLSGFWGTAWEGDQSATTAVSFAAGNKIAANFGGSVSGLTLPKLIELKRQLRKANVNFKKEAPIILLDADGESDLFNIDKYVNFDYQGNKPLVDGELKPWMGFRFLPANLGDPEAYPTSAGLFKPGSYNRLPVIVPSGLARVTWVEFWGKAGEPMPDKQYSEQIYAEAESAVVRTDEKKCWYIETNPVS